MDGRARNVALIAASAMIALASCGGDDGDADVSTSAASTPSEVTTASSSAATTTTLAVATAGGAGLVVDTDLAADDIVALSYLTSRDDLDLLALTVSGTGEVRCPRGADVARGLLVGMERADVPVACGRTTPLAGDRAFPEPWRDAADNGWGLLFQSIDPPADQPTAVELLTETIGGAATPVTVLSLGPLTNLAEALAADPALAPNIERIVIMGGAVDVPGNVYPDGATEPLSAEWNFYVDPTAAAAVLASGVPVTLVALDATDEVPVTDDVIDRLMANDTNAATDRVLRLFVAYPPQFLWDPLAAIAAVDPALLPTHPAEIAVVTEGDDAGRTVAEPGGAAIDVADAPEPDAVIDHLLRGLAAIPEDGQLAPTTTLPVLGDVSVGFDGSTCTYTGAPTLTAGAYVVTVQPASVPYVAAIAHLAEGATVDDVLTWIGEHPDEEPPMVDEVTVVGGWGEPSPATVPFRAGTVAIACGTEDGAISFADSVAVSG